MGAGPEHPGTESQCPLGLNVGRSAVDWGAEGPGAGLVPDALLSHALNAVSEGALLTDAGQRILYANAAFTTVTGYDAGEVIGRNCRLLQGPGTDPLTVAAIRATLARGETFRGEILNYRKDGAPFWNALTVSPLRDGDGAVTHFVSVQRDITGQKALQERLRFMALHDPVTGLPNRTALDQHLRGLAQRPGRQAAVGVIDLDDFKPINDVHGHEAGDSLLTEFGRRISLRLRDTDFVARLGGDEFVIVIEDLPQENSRVHLESLLSLLHEAVETDFVLASSVAVQVRMSLGLALWEPGAETGDAVLRRADAALYELKARKGRRTRWWQLDAKATPPGARHPGPEFHPSRQAAEPLQRAMALSSAATTHRDRLFNGGLQMHYQPVIDLRSGELHLLEALARLRLDDGSILPPGVFLPELDEEDTHRLFRHSLEQTLQQLSDWDSQGHRLRTSININPVTLLQPQCPQWVASALGRHNIAPHRIVLELLEDPVEHRQVKQQVFNELVGLGVGMAQDDLGAGHSNIRRLTALPFDTVKIDRQVTAQLCTSPIPTMTFLATMAAMGQNMGWRVVTEGLEDAGLREAATHLGIPYGQGYHIARPMPPTQVPTWISESHHSDPLSQLRTLPGALAFHWQFARLASPHPGPPENCPLTSFLTTCTPANDVKEWHNEQHTQSRAHAQASTNLLRWLAERVTNNHTATRPAASKGPGTSGSPEFFVSPLDQ